MKELLEFAAAVLSAIAAIVGLLQIDSVRAAASRALSVRNRRAVLVKTVAFAAVVASVAGFIGLQRWETAQGDTREAERNLRFVVPPAIRKTCESSSPEDGDALAALTCRQPRDSVTIRYELYADDKAPMTRFTRRRTDIGLHEGDCATRMDSYGPYRVGTSNAGQLMCHVRDDQNWLEWVDKRLHVYAVATTPAAKPMAFAMSWWEDAGPTTDGKLQGFPNLHESWLMDRVPAAFRRTCDRPKDYAPPGSVGGVVCKPGGKIGSVWYVRFLDAAALTTYYQQRAAKSRLVDEVECADGQKPTRASYTLKDVEERGRRICYTDKGVNWIEWTHPGELIYAAVSGTDLSMAKLWDWWWNKSGPWPPEDAQK